MNGVRLKRDLYWDRLSQSFTGQIAYLIGALRNKGTLRDVVPSVNRLSVLKRLDEQVLLLLLELDGHQEEPVLPELIAGALHQLHPQVELDVGGAESEAPPLATGLDELVLLDVREGDLGLEVRVGIRGWRGCRHLRPSYQALHVPTVTIIDQRNER